MDYAQELRIHRSQMDMLFEEVSYTTSDVLEVEQECVMAEHALLFAQLNMGNVSVSSKSQTLCHFALLPSWEKDVTSHPHDQSRNVS